MGIRDRDIGSLIKTKHAFINTTVTAAGSGAATEIDGDGIDRQALGSMMESVDVVIHGNVTMASGETLSIALNLQDSATDGSYSDFGTAVASVVVKTATGGALTAAGFEFESSFDIRGAERWMRVQVTPDLGRAGTDTALIEGVIVFGGAATQPAA